MGRAKGIDLPEDAAQRNMSFLAGAPAAMMASMAHDLIRGNRIELPSSSTEQSCGVGPQNWVCRRRCIRLLHRR